MKRETAYPGEGQQRRQSNGTPYVHPFDLIRQLHQTLFPAQKCTKRHVGCDRVSFCCEAAADASPVAIVHVFGEQCRDEQWGREHDNLSHKRRQKRDGYRVYGWKPEHGMSRHPQDTVYTILRDIGGSEVYRTSDFELRPRLLHNRFWTIFRDRSWDSICAPCLYHIHWHLELGKKLWKPC